MPSSEGKRRRARRRAERKAERPKKQLQRWINLPKDLYPYEKIGNLPHPKSAERTSAILRAEQNLPWPIEKARHPCRPYHPEDLWEIGALKKALFIELESCASGELMPPPSRKGKEKEQVRSKHEHCLHHILCCWYANLKRYDSAGPSFLVHILKRDYDDPIAFANLQGEDNQLAWTLRRAAPKGTFHVFLGRLRRVAYATSSISGDEPKMTYIQRSECLLQDLVHAGDKKVSVQPRITEEDLLDEWYFEDGTPDECGDRYMAAWVRTVLIIVPTVFIDDFIGSFKSSDEISSEDAPQDDASQNGDVDNDQEEEEFECEDEEAMRERAHELSQHCLIMKEETDQQNIGSDVEVQDEYGNTHMFPASMFEEPDSGEHDGHQATLSTEDKRNISASSSNTTTHPMPSHANDYYGMDRWKIARIGNNSLIRAKLRHLQDKEGLD